MPRGGPPSYGETGRRSKSHAGAAVAGIGAALLFVLALTEYYGYIPSSALGMLDPTTIGVFFVLALFFSVGVYAYEDSH